MSYFERNCSGLTIRFCPVSLTHKINGSKLKIRDLFKADNFLVVDRNVLTDWFIASYTELQTINQVTKL